MTNAEAASLAVRAQAGDLEARDGLCMAHAPVVERVTGDAALQTREAREDLRQELHLAMLADVIPRFDPERGVPFRSWAFSRLRHVATRETRRTWRSDTRWQQDDEAGLDWASQHQAAPSPAPPDWSWEGDAILRMLRKALAEGKLREVEAEAFRLRLGGAKELDVAERLGRSRQTVTRYLSKARDVLGEMFQEDCERGSGAG